MTPEHEQLHVLVATCCNAEDRISFVVGVFSTEELAEIEQDRLRNYEESTNFLRPSEAYITYHIETRYLNQSKLAPES